MFQCSSASRKFLNDIEITARKRFYRCFSALQRAENSSIRDGGAVGDTGRQVSVLFSEPKIPQSPPVRYEIVNDLEFQCSSASRKFLNISPNRRLISGATVSVLFSEPKIPQSIWLNHAQPIKTAFQCSSASRKFLNPDGHAVGWDEDQVSVLFSEPKIPQSNCVRCGNSALPSFSALQRAENSSILRAATTDTPIKHEVSVLFSEPKIPQSNPTKPRFGSVTGFSALQRAENSSIQRAVCKPYFCPRFQCSSASRKFLNSLLMRATRFIRIGFSALQRAENSSISRRTTRTTI